MKNDNNTQVNGIDPKINAIKEIIFGSEIKDYNQQFEELSNSLEKQKVDFEKQIQALKKEMQNAVERLQNQLKQTETKLNAVLDKEVDSLKEKKADRKQLAKLFAQLSEKLAS